MRWENRRQSKNIEDRRNSSAGRVGGGIGLAGILIVLVGWYFDMDLSPIARLVDNQTEGVVTAQTEPVSESTEENRLRRLAATVLADTEDAWSIYFNQQQLSYRQPTLVLYRNTTQTGCGFGQAVMGPFYCPQDEKVYIDLAFYQDMQHQLKAAGDFAFSYVLAHEVGHHVQNLLGTTAEYSRQKGRISGTEANKLSVKIELQADCFAGVWAHYMDQQQVIDNQDITDAINSAASVGDDRLQRQSTGRVVEDSFTHGTSEQRMSWFKRGMQTGDPAQCNP